jgi:hypothetical protein
VCVASQVLGHAEIQQAVVELRVLVVVEVVVVVVLVVVEVGR